MIEIFLDTSDNKKIKVFLRKDNKQFAVFSTSRKNRSEILLRLIDKILKKAKISVSDIDKIYVEKKGTSFTGLKIGVSVANALSFCLVRPVNNKCLGEIEEPLY